MRRKALWTQSAHKRQRVHTKRKGGGPARAIPEAVRLFAIHGMASAEDDVAQLPRAGPGAVVIALDAKKKSGIVFWVIGKVGAKPAVPPVLAVPSEDPGLPAVDKDPHQVPVAVPVEADGRIYRIHHVKEHSAYKQLLAFLIRNGLLGRYLVFFIDGETKISDSIEKYFSAWDHTINLDYHHLQEKIYDYMSSMIIAKRVDDPSSPVEYYKNGDRKGQPKPRAKTSLSRLFAKEASLIAWVGNTAALISYIRLIPAEYVKMRRFGTIFSPTYGTSRLGSPATHCARRSVSRTPATVSS